VPGIFKWTLDESDCIFGIVKRKNVMIAENEHFLRMKINLLIRIHENKRAVNTYYNRKLFSIEISTFYGKKIHKFEL